MAIDSRIPLGVQVPEFATPYQNLGGALSLKRLMQETEFAPLELQLRREQMENLARHREMQEAIGMSNLQLRKEDIERKRRGGVMNMTKDALANSLSAFMFQGPEAGKMIFERQMAPIWQAAGYTPEEIEQSKSMVSPELLQQYLGPEGEENLFQVADRALRTSPQMFTDEGVLVKTGGGFVQTAPGGGGMPEWLSREPQTPEDWKKWDALIAISRQLKKEGGMTGKVEENQFIDVPGLGSFPNPKWKLAQRNKMEMELYKYKEQQKYKKPDTIFMGGDRVPLTKPTENDLQTLVSNADKGLERINNIMENFDPSFLRAGPQLKMKGLELYDWLIGLDPESEEAQKAQKYWSFQTDAYENLNRYINEITGAAMGEDEAVRIRKAAPDPETDGPMKFKTKADRLRITLRRARNVYVDILKKGLPVERAQQEAMKAILSGIEQPLSKPAAKPATKPAAKPADPLGIR